MDFLRTLKRRKPKKHITARVNVVPPKNYRASSGGSRVKKLSAMLNLAPCLALFLGLAVVTQAHAENYFIYQTPNGALVISNKEPPPGSKIIRQHSWPEGPEKEVAQNQPLNNSQPNAQTEGSPKPSMAK